MGSLPYTFRSADGIDWPKVAHHCRYRVKNLAQLSRMSAHELRRYCVRQFGCTPKQWLMRWRLRQCELLIASRRTASEISRLLFYTDAAHFCRDFKKHRGLRAREWRERRRLPQATALR
jgi:AraC-like DNA-binding protein